RGTTRELVSRHARRSREPARAPVGRAKRTRGARARDGRAIRRRARACDRRRVDELCVIERTSTRHAIREPEDGIVVVTNDYRELDAVAAATTVLAEPACGRFERALARARAERPEDDRAAFSILRDPGVQMQMTVQQMVLHAASGRIAVQAP